MAKLFLFLLNQNAETRVNEARLTDTTLVHKHEQQALKVKHKSKRKDNANTREHTDVLLKWKPKYSA